MKIYLLVLIVSLLGACSSIQKNDEVLLNKEMHTYSNYKDVTTKHLEWKASINFEQKQIDGIATWSFENKNNANMLVLDAYDLSIKKVIVGTKEVNFTLGTFNKEYGCALVIPISAKDTVVQITYSTGKNATALQWLAPSQTAGKKLPYLFTQCESIQARSLIPCQDVPAIRITYNADLQVPIGMMALMSAKNPITKNNEGKYHFEMEIPIPSYLIALAVGDIEYAAIDARSGVYTEPCMLSKAAAELSDIPKMMQSAESIGGPYKWGKYDVLIAPPSFPIGGMENPRLTFATPTILAGDKSLVSLIAHEMAHSWSGNLVTNATWSDIWLNEGFTTYFERRIMENLTGKSYNDMQWELGFQDMQSDFNDMGISSPDTRLRIDLNGRNPEDGFSNIPYEKGAVFLKTLEESIGRSKFDTYMNAYFQSNAFKPMTTEACLAFMDEHLFNNDTMLRNTLLVHEWVYEPGLPKNCVHIIPARFIAIDHVRSLFEKVMSAKDLNTKTWTTHEWLQFLRLLPHPLDLAKMQDLDANYKLTGIANSEIADEWYKLSIASNYENAYPAMQLFLGNVGRKKFLEPLYSELLKTDKGKKMAKDIFAKSKDNYHPLTAKKIETLINN